MEFIKDAPSQASIDSPEKAAQKDNLLRWEFKVTQTPIASLELKDHAHCGHILIPRLSFTREVGLVAAEQS